MQAQACIKNEFCKKNTHLFPDETWQQYLNYDEHFTFGLLE